MFSKFALFAKFVFNAPGVNVVTLIWFFLNSSHKAFEKEVTKAFVPKYVDWSGPGQRAAVEETFKIFHFYF